MTGDADQIGNLRILSIHGLKFHGIIQVGRRGGPFSLAFREECPAGGGLDCLDRYPHGCPHFAGFRNNREAGNFSILCEYGSRTGGSV